MCANSWDTRDAIVVCREERLGNNGTALQSAYNQMEILWLSGVECMGNESQLSFCPHGGIGSYAVDDCPYVSAVECFGKGKLYKYTDVLVTYSTVDCLLLLVIYVNFNMAIISTYIYIHYYHQLAILLPFYL